MYGGFALLDHSLLLTPDVHNSKMFLSQLIGKFHIFWRDGEHTLAGGVFISVSNNYICSRESKLETNCKIIWDKLNIVGYKALYICANYNPSEGNEVSLPTLVCPKPSCNYPELTVCRLPAADLTQLITEPTWGANVLDLFVTNNEALTSKTQVIPDLRDHEIHQQNAARSLSIRGLIGKVFDSTWPLLLSHSYR